jgi:hypothetical protein
MADIAWVVLSPPERRRTYYFPGGDEISFYDVVRIEVRPSGKHRIETKDGHKAFVAPGWLWLIINSDDWTF